VDLTAVSPRDVAAADADGDGDIDIFAACSSGGERHYLWTNTNGDGSAWVRSEIVTTGNANQVVSAHDIDGDGDVDAVVTRGGSDRVDWARNNGDGTWTSIAIGGPTGFDKPRGAEAADLDGDGDLDVVATAFGSDTLSWFENTAGDGSAWTRVDLSTAIDGARAVTLADLDGDGDVDIAAGAQVDDDLLWFENTNGDATAWTQNALDAAFDAPNSLEAVDVDADGDVDLVAVSP